VNIRGCVIVISFAAAFCGCTYQATYELPEPTPTGDETSVLEIVPGDLDDLTVVANTEDAEIFRFDIVNHSGREVVLGLLPVGIHRMDREPSEMGAFTDVKFQERASIYTVMGPRDLDPSVGENIYLEDEVILPAGETTTFVLRADIGDISGRHHVTVGTLVALLEDVVYTDTFERVPDEHIRNNRIIGRMIDVLNPAEMRESGTTALVVTYLPIQAIVHPEDSTWYTLGTLFLDSYGGDSVFRGMDVFGSNIGLIGTTTIARGGTMVGDVTTPVSVGGSGTVRLSSPMTVRDGERVILDIWGNIPTTPGTIGEFTFGPVGTEIDADAADGGDFVVVVSARSESHLRVLWSEPQIVGLPVSNRTLVNGLEQELFKFQISPYTASPVFLASFTFRLAGGSGGSVRGLHIRFGSADLSATAYYIVRTGDETPLEPSSSLNAFSSQFTVVFTTPGGYPINRPGHMVTIVGTPDGFDSGDELHVLFGDRIFSSYNGLFGGPTAGGQITYSDGHAIFPLTDPIIWSDGTVEGFFTGAWHLQDLSRIEILTR